MIVGEFYIPSVSGDPPINVSRDERSRCWVIWWKSASSDLVIEEAEKDEFVEGLTELRRKEKAGEL